MSHPRIALSSDNEAMPHLLRKIDHKTNWARDGEFSQYIPANEAPADALQDLKTSGNKLSVWRIDDDRRNLPRVLAAIASLRDNLQKFDYIIFDLRHIEENGLQIEARPGQTLDADANSKWHFDLIHVSASGLSKLANAMFAHGEKSREYDRELIKFLRQSISEGHIQESKLKPGVAAKVRSS